EGSRSNVMGLPMEAFEKNLVQFRWECLHEPLPKSCRLLAVSKKQSLDRMRWVFEMGQRDFAENYVQEALSKMQAMRDLPIRWHFIGHLQKNKVQQVLGLFDCIQSVDSRDLMERIQRCAQDRGLVQKIFLQVNLANEESKKGFSAKELRQVLQESSRFSNLDIAGLMTFPPLQDPELNRVYFRQLRELRDELQKTQPGIKALSMGTSEDFKIAIEEGSTDVRLGSVLFGERS
ncbi:MAG: YggS family pyridoxal phosphate-dependent enzyme, partial [Bdellovibrio sp.]